MTRESSTLTSLVVGIALCAAVLLSAAPAAATNGYFSHGYGSVSKALAGAGVALTDDPMAAATNPAGMVWLGKDYYLGLSVFNPNRSYTIKGEPSRFPGTFGLAPGTVDSDSEYFYIPAVNLNWKISDKSTFGVTMYGHGGMNTDYPTNTFLGSSPTGVNLSQLFVVNTYSRRLGKRHSIGISAVIVYQQFEAKGFEAFGPFSSDSTKLSNNGSEDSFGYGLKLGYLGEWADGFFFGASYQSEMQMQEFDAYAGLFAEQGGFNIPSSYTVGIAWEATSSFTVLFDVQGIMYSDVKSVSNPFLPNLVLAPLGSDNGAGFGWEDMTIYKLGLQWKSSDAWTWRFGYSKTDQPIPASEVLFNIISPGVMEDHVTAGFSRTMKSGNQFHVALLRALPESVTGPNPLEAPGQQTIELQMDQWELDFSYSWRF